MRQIPLFFYYCFFVKFSLLVFLLFFAKPYSFFIIVLVDVLSFFLCVMADDTQVQAGASGQGVTQGTGGGSGFPVGSDPFVAGGMPPVNYAQYDSAVADEHQGVPEEQISASSVPEQEDLEVNFDVPLDPVAEEVPAPVSEDLLMPTTPVDSEEITQETPAPEVAWEATPEPEVDFSLDHISELAQEQLDAPMDAETPAPVVAEEETSPELSFDETSASPLDFVTKLSDTVQTICSHYNQESYDLDQ